MIRITLKWNWGSILMFLKLFEEHDIETIELWLTVKCFYSEQCPIFSAISSISSTINQSHIGDHLAIWLVLQAIYHIYLGFFLFQICWIILWHQIHTGDNSKFVPNCMFECHYCHMWTLKWYSEMDSFVYFWY